MPDPVRLLVITHNYPRFEGDFAGVFLSVLNRRLPEQGIKPIVLAPHYPGVPEFEEKDGVTIYRFRYGSDEEENLAYRGAMHKLVLGSVTGIFRFKNFLDCFRKAAYDIIEKESIQVVAGHWLIPAGPVMKSIAGRYRLPMVLSSHGTDIRLISKYMGLTYRYLRGFCYQLKRWTLVSSFLRDEVVRLDPAIEKILTVLPLPHDEAIFFRDEAIARDKNLIVAVTRFTDQKRPDYLIRAMALVAEDSNSARLEIYGTGPREQEIKALISKSGLDNKVTVNPPVKQSELRGAYNRAGIVVLNSFREGFGLALSEAMLCGACVIGTDSGGIPDIITHEKTGLLVPLDDSDALAKAILGVQDDDSRRNELALAGYRFATETYASGPLAAAYGTIIRAALGSR